MKNILRQGDVVIIPRKLPEGATPAGNEIKIASETGNAHLMYGKVFKAANTQYVVLENPAKMLHPEHKPVTVPAGTYEIRTVRDFYPTAQLD